MKTAICVQSPVVDYLVFQLKGDDWYEGTGKTRFDRICSRIDAAINEGKCEPAYVQGQRYHKGFRVVLPNGQKPTVLLGALQPERQNGGVRISLNPSKLSQSDIAQFHAVMDDILRSLYRMQLKTPLLNRFDVAIDLINTCLDQLLISYKNAQKMTMFAKRFDTKGHIEGYNFGSLSSDYLAAVYDKKIERLHHAVQRIGARGLQTEELRTNVVRQIRDLHGNPERVRIEIRGLKLRSISPRELLALPNRFDRFAITDLSAEGSALSPCLEKSFLAICRQNGIKDAFDTFKNNRCSRKLHAYYKSRQAPWWHPEAMWSDACNALRESGLFPEEAFDLEGAYHEEEEEGFLI